MKKICHMTSVHSRYDSRIYRRECLSLSKKYDVYLVVVDSMANEVDHNLKIVSIGKNYKNRADRIFSLTRDILRKGLEIDADVYHLHDPELLMIAGALKRKGKCVIFDSHEDVPNTIIDKYWIPSFLRKIVANIYSIYERNVLHRIDAVISVTPHIVRRLSKFNVNTIQITNFPVINEDECTMCQSQEINEKFVAFAGVIGFPYLHESVIQAMEGLECVRYKIAGSVNDENYLSQLKEAKEFDRVDLLGMLSWTDVLTLYKNSLAGISMASYDANSNGQEGSLGILKNFEIMYSGVPLICSKNKIWENIINEEKCGICVDPNDVLAIQDAIRFIISNPDTAKQMGENGYHAVLNKYNWNTQEKILFTLYENLIGKAT